MKLKKYKNGVEVLQFDLFTKFPEIIAFVSTRVGGVSKDEFKGLNISYASGDEQNNVKLNKKLLYSLFETKNDSLMANLVHGKEVSIIDKIISDKQFVDKSDAIITDQRKLPILVTCADCLSIILYDSSRKVIGIVHAGWKGALANIIHETIHKMIDNFGSDINNIYVTIGPGICQKHYEVGQEVKELFDEKFSDNKFFIKSKDIDKWFLNLKKVIAYQLFHLGIKNENVEISNICTFEDHRLYSARRDGRTGRFAAGIMMK